MKKGSLTDVEKHAIDGMVSKGMEVNKIKEALERSPNSRVVEEYVKTTTKKTNFSKKDVLLKLAEAGIRHEDAERLTNKAIKKLQEDDVELGVSVVYNEAIRSVGPRELMQRESSTGSHDGNVVIMTEQAAKFEAPKGSTKARNQDSYVFKPEK